VSAVNVYHVMHDKIKVVGASLGTVRVQVQTLLAFGSNERRYSIPFVVGDQGCVTRVSEKRRGHCNGFQSQWASQFDHNSITIGNFSHKPVKIDIN